jgi:trehalose 6-phosphate phosphatase
VTALDATFAPLVARPADSGFLVDFDGSLAPIVARPEDARPLPGAGTVLTRLARRLGRVAVVSGRSVEFLVAHLPVDGVALAGLYGLEALRDGERVVDPRVAPYVEAIAAAATEAERRLPGVLVERKGEVSVTLHWRTTPGREAEVRVVAADLAAAHGLEAPQRGKQSVELRPPVPVDKGTAVEALLEGLAIGAFAGDDAGDLPAFAALDRMVATGRLDHVVRVGVRSEEAPAEVVAEADLVVDGPEGLLAVLVHLADELGA